MRPRRRVTSGEPADRQLRNRPLMERSASPEFLAARMNAGRRRAMERGPYVSPEVRSNANHVTRGGTPERPSAFAVSRMN